MHVLKLSFQAFVVAAALFISFLRWYTLLAGIHYITGTASPEGGGKRTGLCCDAEAMRSHISRRLIFYAHFDVVSHSDNVMGMAK